MKNKFTALLILQFCLICNLAIAGGSKALDESAGLGASAKSAIKVRSSEQIKLYENFEYYYGPKRLEATEKSLKALPFYHAANVQKNLLKFEINTKTKNLEQVGEVLLQNPQEAPLDLNALIGINNVAAQTWELILKCSGGMYELGRRSYFEQKYSCIDAGSDAKIKQNLEYINSALLNNFVNTSQIKNTYGSMRIANLHPLLIQLITENLISELNDMADYSCDTRVGGASIKNCVYVKTVRNFLLNTEKSAWDSDREELATRYSSDPGFQKLRRVHNLFQLFGLLDTSSSEACLGHGFWPIFTHKAIATLAKGNSFLKDPNGFDFEDIIKTTVTGNGYGRCPNIDVYSPPDSEYILLFVK